METIIAAGVAVVVGGGLLTLVYRILRGESDTKKVEASLDALAAEAEAEREAKSKKSKKKK